MTFNYAKSQATASRLIAKFGQSAVIRRLENTGTDYEPELEDANYDCTLVVLDFDDTKIDGTLILQSDKMVYVSVSGLTIEIGTGDKLLIGDQEMAVINAKPLSPAGTVIFYEVQVRA